jgi:hypothetical protein
VHQIRTAATYIDDAVVADAQIRAKLLKHGDLAPARGCPNDRVHYAGHFVAPEARAEDGDVAAQCLPGPAE